MKSLNQNTKLFNNPIPEKTVSDILTTKKNNMSFIETMPEDDIRKLAERLQQYIVPKSEQKDIKSVNQIYTVKDAALLTSKSRQTIRSHIKIGLLEAKKTGKNYIITIENLTKYIENEK